MTGNIVAVKASLDEEPFFQEWQKRTGVKLKFVFQNHFRLSSLDECLEEIRSLGIGRAIAIQEEALARYKAQ